MGAFFLPPFILPLFPVVVIGTGLTKTMWLRSIVRAFSGFPPNFSRQFSFFFCFPADLTFNPVPFSLPDFTPLSVFIPCHTAFLAFFFFAVVSKVFSPSVSSMTVFLVDC